MLVLGIFLILFGLLMLIKPNILWMITESWKTDGATEPTNYYIFSVRLGGILFILAGIGGIVAFALS
jgi:hypothetical protein